jgi:hypothetical protein
MILYQNVLSALLLNAFPFLCVLAIWCLKFFEHLLPARQQEMLERCVQMAVAMAEQSYADYGPLEKKQIALRASIDLFHAFHLPVPQSTALNTAIEASVFAVRQAQAQAKTTVPLESTVRVPVVSATPTPIVSVAQPQFVSTQTPVAPSSPM